MAWSWRKRKTILPGVRLNFGKKGISTTLGPRGASVTFGPNGTYFNTSIPGTGLYNRQKIGGKNSTYTPMNNDSSGCQGCALKVVAIVEWLFLFGIVLFGFVANVWLGSAFLGVVMVTHLIVAIVMKNKAAKVPTSPSTTNTTTPNSYHITEDFYNQVTKVVEEVYAVYEKVIKLHDIESLVDSVGIRFVMNGAPMTKVKDKVRLLFWIDVTRCYSGLGHLIDLNSKEGLGLLYFIALTEGCTPKKPYYNLAIMKAEGCRIYPQRYNSVY